MRTLTLQLIGTTPLLLHHISRHEFRQEIASQKGGEMSLEEEALSVMSKDADGNPAVPVSWLWDAIRAGCSRITVEQKQISFVTFQSAVALPEGLVSLKGVGDGIPLWEPHSSMQHGGPKSKKSIVVVAPKFRDWRISLQASIPDDFSTIGLPIEGPTLQRIFWESGRTGIGLFHPPKKNFGQFRVEMSG